MASGWPTSDYGAGNAQIWTVPLEDQGGQLKAGKPEQFLKSSFADMSSGVLARRAMAGVSLKRIGEG